MNNDEINMGRPKGFTLLTVFFAYITFAGIAKGLQLLQLASVYGNIPGILGFIYGLSAMVVAYGLWFYRPWVFYAEIFWSISAFAWLFNWQYGLKGKYTLPLHYFILYAVFLITLFILIAFYIKKRLRVLNESLSLAEKNDKNEN